jgi:DeoR family glycerol-3-phosphate regulon repressor/DeoR family fructose operon transcriptional repressor
LPAGRKAQLAAFVAEAGQVTVSALSERFGVSIDTIRRDLDQLSEEGILVRTYGGAVSPSTVSRPDPAVDVRMNIQAKEKEAIATVAATLVENSSSVMINGGTTALALARALHHHRDLTVATNNLLIAPAMPSTAIRELYVLGGAVRSLTMATIGPVTLRTANGADLDISCDLGFIGIGALSVAAGYTTSNVAEAAMMREMIGRSSRVAILADSSKFDRRLFAQVAELAAADYLITDAAPSGELRDALQRAGVEILTPGAR